jgi:hypothetical protein
VSRTMSHYWTADDPPAARQVQLEDWLELVGDFPVDELRRACMTWLATQARRPTPSDILALLNPPPVYVDPAHKPFPHDPRSLDEIAEQRRAIAHRWQDVLAALRNAR